MYTFFKEIKVSEEESNQSSVAMGHFDLQPAMFVFLI